MATTYYNSATAFYRYTKGKEYALDLEEYIGEYHFRGASPYSGPIPSEDSKPLAKYHPSKHVLIYNQLFPKQQILLTHTEPTKGAVYPTEDNFGAGEMFRFFVQNRLNKNIIIEIDHTQAANYGKPSGIDPTLYQLGELKWKLTKVENKLRTIGFANSKEVQKLNKEMVGIADVIFSYTEFSEIII